jgi:hypothetical protein
MKQLIRPIWPSVPQIPKYNRSDPDYDEFKKMEKDKEKNQKIYDKQLKLFKNEQKQFQEMSQEHYHSFNVYDKLVVGSELYALKDDKSKSTYDKFKYMILDSDEARNKDKVKNDKDVHVLKSKPGKWISYVTNDFRLVAFHSDYSSKTIDYREVKQIGTVNTYNGLAMIMCEEVCYSDYVDLMVENYRNNFDNNLPIMNFGVNFGCFACKKLGQYLPIYIAEENGLAVFITIHLQGVDRENHNSARNPNAPPHKIQTCDYLKLCKFDVDNQKPFDYDKFKCDITSMHKQKDHGCYETYSTVFGSDSD